MCIRDRLKVKIADPNLEVEDREVLVRNYLEGPVNPIDRVDMPQGVLDFLNGQKQVAGNKAGSKVRVGPGFWETPVMELAVRRYRSLSNLLFLPFFALFMQVTVQNKIFDNIVIPKFEIGFYVLSFLVLISASLLMQSRVKKCLSEAMTVSYTHLTLPTIYSV